MDKIYNNGVVNLLPEFAHFEKCGDFLGLCISGDLSKLSESELDLERKPHYDRVRLRRAFPFTEKERFISVLDDDQNEIGLIEDISVFSSEQASLIREELDRVYYLTKIQKIKSVKEKIGRATYFICENEDGEFEVVLRDVSRTIFKLNDDSVIITDIDSNRYIIESLSALDKKSFKKLEVYM